MVVDVTENKLILIGEIDFYGCDDDLTNESSIVSKDSEKPNIRGIGKCEVFIGSDEGPVPHIHIKSNDTRWGVMHMSPLSILFSPWWKSDDQGCVQLQTSQRV